jgi:hypothetical protein
MALQIKKAVKYGAKMRLALYGPAGSGKTYTALKIATEMAGDKRILVIDSERGSASKYADIFDFDVIEITDFHPQTYIQAIRMAVQAKEYDVLIIDSASQEWDGTRGALELAGHRFQNWEKVTPLHNAFIDAMLSANVHVICTMRAKEEHVMETDKDGKPTVKSVGVEPIQRKYMKYEFDVIGALDVDNTMSIVKTRCSDLHGRSFFRAEKEIAEIMKRWLDGIPAPEPQPAPELPAPVPAPEPTQMPARPANDGPATETQLATIQKLQRQLGMEPIANLDGLSFADAAQLLKDYSQQLQAKRKSA